jgi:hypothetical protein
MSRRVWGSYVLLTVLLAATVVGCAPRPAPTPIPQREFPTLAPFEPGAEPTITPMSDPTPTATPLPDPTPVDPVVPTPPDDKAQRVEVEVTDMELKVGEIIPGEVVVVLRGNMPETCIRIIDVRQQVRGELITLSLVAIRPPDVLCAQVLTPFEVTTMLSLEGLQPGSYTVRANGVEAELILGEAFLSAPREDIDMLPTGNLAPVDEIQVNLLESLPGQASVTIRGTMPDACTKVNSFSQQVSENTIYLRVYAERPADRMCAQVLTPYQETLLLNLSKVTPGEYMLDVNGITQTLTLEPDMLGVPREPREPTDEVVTGRAAVDSVEVVEVGEASATIVVRGNLPDGCTEIADHVQAVQGHIIRIELYTERPADQFCTEALVPFDEEIMLDLRGLEKGQYVVDVNGVRAELVIP